MSDNFQLAATEQYQTMAIGLEPETLGTMDGPATAPPNDNCLRFLCKSTQCPQLTSRIEDMC